MHNRMNHKASYLKITHLITGLAGFLCSGSSRSLDLDRYNAPLVVGNAPPGGEELL